MVEERGEPLGRVALHGRQDVPVDPEGDFDALVPESLRHNVGRNAG